MWPYYGGKYLLAPLYPKPKHDLIIEPFAGTAQYSLIHFENEIVLVDKWDVIIRIWKWLQNCSQKDILGLPRLKQGERLSSLNLSEEEKLFMGFIIGQGQAPRDKASVMTTTYRPNRQDYTLRKAANQLFKIKHWKFILGSYECLENTEATWFIDPPYQHGGHVYVMTGNRLDYPLFDDAALPLSTGGLGRRTGREITSHCSTPERKICRYKWYLPEVRIKELHCIARIVVLCAGTM